MTSAPAEGKKKECKTYKQENFRLDFYENFIPEDYALQLLEYIDKNAKWNRVDQKKRGNANYGDVGVSYTLTKGEKVALTRTCNPWSDMPLLKQLADLCSQATGEKSNYVRCQRYATKRVGIPPHRDRELAHGTAIVGLSLGDSRMMTFRPPAWMKEDGAKDVQIEVTSGSLYVIRPPTNDYYSHCIEAEKEDGGLRISLTFCYQPAEDKTYNSDNDKSSSEKD